jgi:RNA polymerase sigma-70 factor (ECF subfamily)
VPEENVDERRLIEEVLQGSPAAERAFYDAHVDRVFALAYRMTGDETVAQDCTQETFIRAFANLHSFRGESRLSTWLHRITVSSVLNGMRKMKRHRNREVDLQDVHLDKAGKATSPGLRHRLERALATLSEEARTVLMLHDVEGYQHNEIGDMLGIPVGTSKARLSRARQTLRQQLQPDSMEWT